MCLGVAAALNDHFVAEAGSIPSAHPRVFSHEKHGGRQRAAPYPSPSGVANCSMAMRHLAPAPRVVRADSVPSGRQWQCPPSPMSAEPLRAQDRLNPLANVGRLMAMELPRNAKISNEAKVLMQEMVTEFICFVTSEANDLSLASKRRALRPDDILSALKALGMRSRARSRTTATPSPAACGADDDLAHQQLSRAQTSQSSSP